MSTTLPSSSSSTPAFLSPSQIGAREIELKALRIHSHYIHECLSAILHTILYLRAPNHNFQTSDYLCEDLFPFIFTKCGPQDLDKIILQTIEVFRSSLYRSPEDDNNLRGEIVLSFYDRKEVKEYFGFVTRHEQIYFERWKIAIVLVEEKPQSNNSNASLLKEQQYQSAYDQLSAIVLSIIESVNAASDHLPLALYDYEMTIMEPPTPSTDFSGIPLFFSLYGSPFTATCSKNRFCPPEIYMGRMLSDETKAIGYVTPGELVFPNDMTDEWELDCYSRPVIGEDGKKLWELLLTDSESRFRYLKPIPSNLVNSRNVRKIVEDILEQSPVRPKSIRFFRNQMFNMINIALSTLDVDVKPSRRTTSLYMWLQEREENVYPLMAGYNPQLKQQTILDYDVTQPDRLPDVFKAESYAFVALPSEVFWDGQVNAENIKKGRLCPIRDIPRKEGTWVHGINLFSKR
eukprot:gene23496-30462_t